MYVFEFPLPLPSKILFYTFYLTSSFFFGSVCQRIKVHVNLLVSDKKWECLKAWLLETVIVKINWKQSKNGITVLKRNENCLSMEIITKVKTVKTRAYLRDDCAIKWWSNNIVRHLNGKIFEWFQWLTIRSN